MPGIRMAHLADALIVVAERAELPGRPTRPAWLDHPRAFRRRRAWRRRSPHTRGRTHAPACVRRPRRRRAERLPRRPRARRAPRRSPPRSNASWRGSGRPERAVAGPADNYGLTSTMGSCQNPRHDTETRCRCRPRGEFRALNDVRAAALEHARLARQLSARRRTMIGELIAAGTSQPGRHRSRDGRVETGGAEDARDGLTRCGQRRPWCSGVSRELATPGRRTAHGGRRLPDRV